jgi:hypothetical protein
MNKKQPQRHGLQPSKGTDYKSAPAVVRITHPQPLQGGELGESNLQVNYKVIFEQIDLIFHLLHNPNPEGEKWKKAGSG